MLKKKTAGQITGYYQQETVVKGYDRRRFEGLGGKYINSQETEPIIEFVRAVTNKKDRILDLGAGRGRLTQPLTKINKNVYCLEKSQAMVAYLKKNVPASHILLQSIFDPLPKKNSFRLITSLRFFEHFKLQDQKKILKNISPRIEKEGYVVYASVNTASLEGAIARFFPYGRYNYFYSDQEYQQLFKRCGLESVMQSGRFVIPRGVFLHLRPQIAVSALIKLDTFLSRVMPHACAYQVYLLRKV